MTFTKRTAILYAVFLIPSGILMCWVSCWALIESYKSYSWLETTGEIIHKTVEETFEGSGVTDLRPKVEYMYDVNNTMYIGDTISLATSHRGSIEELSPVLEKYEIGEKIPVFYDPNNPQDSALEIGFKWGTIIYLIPGVVLTYCGLKLLVLSFRRRRTEDFPDLPKLLRHPLFWG